MEVDPHHILIEDPDGSCTLILDNLTGVDSGQYMCFAASAAGNASTLGKILVQGEPGREARCKAPGPRPTTAPTGLQACGWCGCLTQVWGLTREDGVLLPDAVFFCVCVPLSLPFHLFIPLSFPLCLSLSVSLPITLCVSPS